MAFHPIQWAKQTTDGRQPNDDGAALLDLYATNPVPKDESKASVVLFQTPGYESVGDFPESNPPADTTYDLIALETAKDGSDLTLVGSVFRVAGGTATLSFSKATLSGSPLSVQGASTWVALTSTDRGTVARLRTFDNHAMLLFNGRLYGFEVDSLNAVTIANPDGYTGTFVDLTESEGYMIAGTRDGYLYHTLHGQLAFGQNDFGRARSHMDLLVGLGVFNRRLYVFGEVTVELWVYTGTSDFAFQRHPQFVAEIGCASADTIKSYDQGLCYLGSDGIVYATGGEQFTRVSYEAVEYEIAQSDMKQARAFTYTEEGHRFYSLTLTLYSGTQVNWTLDLTTGFWHNRSAVDILSSARIDGRNYVGLKVKAKLFHYSLDYGTQDEQVVTRYAISPVLHANQQRVRIPSFQVDIPNRPVGSLTGTAMDSVTLGWSNNGKRTWEPSTRPMTQLLNTFGRRRWNQLGQFYLGRNFRLTIEAKRSIHVLGAYIERRISKN